MRYLYSPCSQGPMDISKWGPWIYASLEST